MKKNKGFLLIKILVGVSVACLLISVFMVVQNFSKIKARTQTKIAETEIVKKALNSYFVDKGSMPSMYDCTSVCVKDPSRNLFEVEDVANPDNPTTESGRAYNRTMQDLVDGKYIPEIIHTPKGSGGTYAYFDSGSTKTGGAGAIFYAVLDQINTTAESCRPKLDEPQIGIKINCFSAPVTYMDQTQSSVTYSGPFQYMCIEDTKGDYASCSTYKNGKWNVDCKPSLGHGFSWSTNSPPPCSVVGVDYCSCSTY